MGWRRIFVQAVAATIAFASTPLEAQAFIPGESPIPGARYDPATPDVVTIEGQDFPLEPGMRPGMSTATAFQLSPDRDVLYARKFATSGGALCQTGVGGGQRVVFFRIVREPSPMLVEIAEECVPTVIQRTSFIGSAADGPYTALIATESGPDIALRWFNLLSSQQVVGTRVSQTLGDIRYAPNGALAWVQSDLGGSSIGTDYHLIDLCDGRLGERITPVGGLADFPASDPYAVSYGTSSDGRQAVDVQIGDEFTTTLLAPPCHAAGTSVGTLAVSIEAQAVSPSDTLVDFTIRYEVTGGYTPAVLSARLPAATMLVSDPDGVVNANQISLTGVVGTGEFTFRTRVLPSESATRCLGIDTHSPVSLSSSWMVTDALGMPVQRSVRQVAASACVAGPRPLLRRVAPELVSPNVPFDIRFEYTNAGDLLATNVRIADQPDFDTTEFAILGSDDASFTRDGDLAAGFDLGDLPAGAEGAVSFRIVASCTAADLESTLYWISSDGRPVSGIDGEPSVTTVRPFSSAPMPVTATVDAPLATAADGELRTFRITFENPVDQVRPVAFRANAEPCWEWNAAGGDGETVVFTPLALTWGAEVPADGQVMMTLEARRVACAEGGAINVGMPVAVNYGCGLSTEVDLSAAMVRPSGVTDGGGATPDGGLMGRDGGAAFDGGGADGGVGVESGVGDAGFSMDASTPRETSDGCSAGGGGGTGGAGVLVAVGLIWARRRRGWTRPAPSVDAPDTQSP